MVTTLADQLPVTPDGNPLNVAPVAPVVEYVICVIAVLIQVVCVLVPAAELNVTVLLAVTVIAIELDVAGDPVKHGVALLVITTFTTSPLDKVLVINVALLVPVFTLFTSH